MPALNVRCGAAYYARTLDDLPPLFTEVADAWSQALEEVRYTAIQDAIRARDVATLKSLWNELAGRDLAGLAALGRTPGRRRAACGRGRWPDRGHRRLG